MLPNTLPNECEACPTTLDMLQAMTPKQSLIKGFGMWLCPTCHAKELALQADNNTKDAQNRRVIEMNAHIVRNRQQNETIELQSDVYNAKTEAIVELQKAIESDITIPTEQKFFALALAIQERYTANAQAIFDARKLLTEKGNEQRALQTYWQTLSNRLHAEERAKIKLQDMNYKPEAPGKPRIKVPKTPKTGKTKSTGKPRQRQPKLDLDLVKSLCKKHGVDTVLIPAITILINGQGLTAEQAVLRMKGK